MTTNVVGKNKIDNQQGVASPVHLPFLDGIRALMALWVATGHAFQDFTHVVHHHAGNSRFCYQQFFVQAFYAHFAVDVFIVLSGFCLMLPVSRSENFELKGGWRGFYLRRARRILPPYYAALMLALSLSALRWYLTKPGWESRVIVQYDFRTSAILAHLFLVQNLWDPWARAIDGPTWSVATEFQIYLLFPLLLLPLWRRFRPITVISVGSAIGLAILFITWNSPKSGWTSCSWFIGLFAMGMYAADLHVRAKTRIMRSRLVALGVSTATCVLLAIAVLQWSGQLMFKLDFLVGASAAALITYFASFSENEPRGFVLKALEWSPLVTMGTSSYSFYLIHAPILYLPVTLLIMCDANGAVGAISLLATLIVIAMLSRVFYRYIELPSMMKKHR